MKPKTTTRLNLTARLSEIPWVPRQAESEQDSAIRYCLALSCRKCPSGELWKRVKKWRKKKQAKKRIQKNRKKKRERKESGRISRMPRGSATCTHATGVNCRIDAKPIMSSRDERVAAAKAKELAFAAAGSSGLFLSGDLRIYEKEPNPPDISASLFAPPCIHRYSRRNERRVSTMGADRHVSDFYSTSEAEHIAIFYTHIFIFIIFFFKIFFYYS